MACRILIKNIANSYSTGDSIAVVDGDHVFGKYESKEQFVKAGNDPIDWPRQFVIVNITDKKKEYYSHLLTDNDIGRRYFVTPQYQDSPYYNDLLEHAEITTTSAVLDSLIQDRGA